MVGVGLQNDTPKFESHGKQVNIVVVSVLSALEILTRCPRFMILFLDLNEPSLTPNTNPWLDKMHSRLCLGLRVSVKANIN